MGKEMGAQEQTYRSKINMKKTNILIRINTRSENKQKKKKEQKYYKKNTNATNKISQRKLTTSPSNVHEATF